MKALVSIWEISGYLVASNNTRLPGMNSSLRPVGKVQFTKDIAHMSLDRLLANHQLSSNFTVAQPFSNYSQDLHLAVGQFGMEVAL